jgi:Ca2+-binding RTX toxin-like protein
MRPARERPVKSNLEGNLNINTMLSDDKSAAFLPCLTTARKPVATNSETSLGVIDTIPFSTSTTATVPAGGYFSGMISPSNDRDLIKIEVVAGQTYTVTLRGIGIDPLDDPFMVLYNNLGQPIIQDDDGGAGTSSLINFTATSTGTYYIAAQSYASSSQPAQGGAYRVDFRQMPTADSVIDSLSTTATVTVGETLFGFTETSADRDMYRVELVAGQMYKVEVAGGFDGYGPANRELDTRLALYDSGGNLVAYNDDVSGSDWSSVLSYYVEEGGTYYVRVLPYSGAIGGYTLDVTNLNIDLTANPLDAIDWGTTLASNHVTVYFARAGETFGGSTSSGWTEYEIAQAMVALEQYENISGLTFSITDASQNATFRLVTLEDAAFLGRMGPPETTNAGVGEFVLTGFGWDSDAPTVGTSDPDNGGLEQGGFGFITLIHEFGHGMGLAHPHDGGGSSSVMEGVVGPFYSFGVFNLNQGIYTTMSYNDGWQTHPDALFGNAQLGAAYGYQGTMSAFDIALLQQKYGANLNFAAGDTVYVLPTENEAGTFWTTIWDAGGIDSIVHNGTDRAIIDLTAATLDYSPTGGGVASFVDGVFGGYTIANGVVIENAQGGSGNDVIIGNSAGNRLSGGAGDDVISGGGGFDYLTGGAGKDRFAVDITGSGEITKRGTLAVDVITDFQRGMDLIDLSGLDANANLDGDQAFTFRGTNANKNAGDLTYKVYENINGAEKALGLELDGISGKGAAGPVTILFGNVDGGSPDFAMVLMGVNVLTNSDFYAL